MSLEQEVYKIGRIGKPHGVRGELTMLCDDDVFDRVDADFLMLRVDGLLVPFYIEEYRFRTDTSVLIKFEGIDTVERARELTGSDVCFPRDMADDDTTLTTAQIVGYTIVDDATATTLGTIAHVDDTTANILFELHDGRLIPATDDFVTHIDPHTRTITMRLPDGLLEL